MTEKQLSHWLVGTLRSLRADPQRIEDALSRGVPDVNCVYGWIETKALPAWPKRATTPVRLQHPRRVVRQCAWLRRRWLAGGGAWMLLAVDRHVILIDGEAAHLNWGVQCPPEPRRQLLGRVAFCSWVGQPTGRELIDALLRSRETR